MFLLFALLQSQSPQQPPPTVEIPRIEAAAVIDGRLDEAAWSQAAVLTDFRQAEPIDGRPAEERTEVRVWYAPDAIHFGIVAYDSRPELIRATTADRDNLDSDDHVILYLDTFDDQRRAFFFGVNPRGAQADGVRTEGSSSAGRTFGGSTDYSPDYVFESAGAVTDEGYVVEVRIPFKSLRYPGGDDMAWGFQVERRIQRTGYTDTWTDVRRANASFLAQAGTLTGLRDLQRGVVLEAQPFVTVAANGAVDPATGRFERADADPDAGLNLRLGFTNISVDATINPDFSQVESDASQVSVNERFALFFPEKRPFFLEGIELFAAPNSLVYTRRVANPIAGGKVTGKLGALGLAYMSALDEGIDDAPDALFNIARLRSDLGANSLVGLLATDRTETSGGDYNRVVAGDARIVFGGLYYAEAQLGGSWTHDEAGTRAGPIAKLELDRTGRSFGFNYNLNVIGDDFETQSGFVNRTGIVSGRAFNRGTWYGARGALLETVTGFAGIDRLRDYDDFTDRSLEGGESARLTFRLRGGWEVETGVERNFVVLDPLDYAGLETDAEANRVAYLPLDEVSGPEFSFGVETPTFRRFDAGLDIGFGRGAIFPEGSEGRGVGISASLNYRPTGWLRVQLTNAYERLARRRDGSEFARTIIPRARVEVQPTRAFFLRAVTEYRAERRSALQDARTGGPLYRDGVAIGAEDVNGLRVDLLAAYEPTPGTVAYLGYGATLQDREAFRFSEVSRLQDGLFLKLAYQFRR